MQKQMLVPLDGSVLAEMALPNVVAMARATASSVILLQVIPSSPQGRPAFPPGRKEEAGAAQAYLWGIEGQLRTEGLQVTSRVREGEPARAIVSEAAEDPNITLIVMSTHGRSGLGRWFFGSVSEQVLRDSRVPLLLVRPEESTEPLQSSYKEAYSTILVPLDGSAGAEQALLQASGLAVATEATVLLVAAASPLAMAGMSVYMEATSYQLYADASEEESKRLSKYLAQKANALRARGLQVKTRVEPGDPAGVILLAADQMEPDLIVMSTQGGTTGALRELQGLLFRNVALKVVQEARLPVLLLPVRGASTLQESVIDLTGASIEPVASAWVNGKE
jgi:nucleotide-binding universal stress UspA family protein